MRDRWIVVLAFAFFLISGGGTAITVLKLGNIERGLSAIALPSSFPSKVDITYRGKAVACSCVVITCADNSSTTYEDCANPGETPEAFGERFRREAREFANGFCGGSGNVTSIVSCPSGLRIRAPGDHK